MQSFSFINQEERTMTITRLLLCTAALLALIVPANAEALQSTTTKKEAYFNAGIKLEEITRYVVSGKSIVLYFEHALNEECSPGEFDVRVLKQPEHGTIELVPATGPAKFRKDNPRSKCNGKKVKGINIVYKSSSGYIGEDIAHVVTFAETGFAFETHWTFKVMR
jgi:hypothetical protein